MSLRLEYSTLHVHVRVHYTLYIQPILCTNNKQSQMVSFMRRESSPFFLEVNGWVQLYGIVAMPVLYMCKHIIIMSLRLEYSTLHVHVRVHYKLHTTYYTLTTSSLRWSHFSQQATYGQYFVNFRDRGNLRTKDNSSVLKVSFVGPDK